MGTRKSTQFLGKEINSVDYFELDKFLGYQPIANTTVRVKKVFGDQIIYDVEYIFDEHHRRVKNDWKNQSKLEKYMIFLGDSNIFGEGVYVHESFPFLMGAKNPTYQIYNYAFRGYGPGNVMGLLDSERLTKEIPERKGFIFYPFLESQARRLVGTTTFFKWSDGLHPNYEYDENGDLKRKGDFKTTQYLRTLLLKKLSNNSLFNRIIGEYPNPYKGKHLKKVCDSLIYIKKEIEHQLREAEFFVILGIKSKPSKMIEKCLTENDISYIDISLKNWQGNSKEYWIHPKDSHLNFKANNHYSDRLTEELERFKKH